MKYRILKVGADWCTPCKKYQPFFDTAAELHSDVKFESVDISVLNDKTIRSVPTTIFYANEVEMQRRAGMMSVEEINAFIKRGKELGNL